MMKRRPRRNAHPNGKASGRVMHRAVGSCVVGLDRGLGEVAEGVAEEVDSLALEARRTGA